MQLQILSYGDPVNQSIAENLFKKYQKSIKREDHYLSQSIAAKDEYEKKRLMQLSYFWLGQKVGYDNALLDLGYEIREVEHARN